MFVDRHGNYFIIIYGPYAGLADGQTVFLLQKSPVKQDIKLQQTLTGIMQWLAVLYRLKIIIEPDYIHISLVIRISGNDILIIDPESIIQCKRYP